jgi:hypothetical protein
MTISQQNPIWRKSPWWRDRRIARLGAFKKWAQANPEERERVERRHAAESGISLLSCCESAHNKARA